MGKIFLLAVISALAVSAFCGCGRNGKDAELLQGFADEINSGSGKELSNGAMLLKCEYHKGDSLFTYYIKVDDNRFDNVPADSVKATLSKDLLSPGMQKLTKVLSRNGIGLRYMYELEDTAFSVVFTPDELTSGK